MSQNIDSKVVAGFGDEWNRFDQSELDPAELERMFDEYFEVFQWDDLPSDAVGFDLGCGSGRWARFVAPRVGKLHLVDPSDAIDVARKNLAEVENCCFHRAAADTIPLEDESCDFGYSLGVLHHMPDTEAGLMSCVAKLKPGAPFLLYLYYRFDNRPAWYRWLWAVSDSCRKVISRLPLGARYIVSQIVAGAVYWPLARLSLVVERCGFRTGSFPLSQYRNRSFYTMRTDALDRLGTRLEKRFTRVEIRSMMERCGLREIRFGTRIFWTAVGTKR